MTTGNGDHLPTNYDQIAFPKLPVPPLEQTMERYLAAIKPIVSESQYERTKAIVKAFVAPGGIGQKLQDKLLERREELDNWAYEWWLHDMYMNNPLPLPVNSNPGMVFPPQEFRSVHDQIRFAARLVDGVLQHKDILDKRALPVDRATSREKGQPMCMAQYYRLFTSCRQPGRPRDKLLSNLAFDPVPNEHIIVSCKNQFYVLPVKVENRRLSEDEIAFQLLQIFQESPALSSPPPVGILTAERRDMWADIREKLCRYDVNKKCLRLIETSLLLICFDEPLSSTFNYKTRPGAEVSRGHVVGLRDETNMAHQMIHGGGSTRNSANRWFDKTVQFVVSSDGVCGLCYEHSPSEGIAVVQLIEDMLKKCSDLPADRDISQPTSELPHPQRLDWIADDEIHQHIQDAAQNIDSLLDDLDFFIYRFTGYGKEFIKSCNVSPDAYIQLALQLAYFRLYRRLTATYESASTRRFLLGRVDCIRSASCEALEWVQAMCQNEEEVLSDDELQTSKRVTFSFYDEQKQIELFDAAVKKQTEIMIQNILGEGIDIHLLGLREMAATLGHTSLEIFQDESYKIANHFALSTSQVPTSSDSFMGYGPVVPDGYGASYNPHKESIVFCLSAFHSCEWTSTWKFSRSLEYSLHSMQQLLQKRKK